MVEPQTARILIVDDDPCIAELLSRQLSAEGYSCAKALSGEIAVELLGTGQEFDLIICDIMMPGMSGIDLLTFVRALFPDIAVVMVTGVDDRITATTALETGAYGYVLKPFERSEILISVASALERRRVTMLSKKHESALEAIVEQRTRQVRQREEELIFRLLSTSEYRDGETGAHIRRVGLYAAEMARALGWNAQAVADIRLAASMHDVGKVGIPDRILRKKGSLTFEEFEIMKQHTEIGARILGGTTIPMLQMARDIALGHHERYDGSGYPRGLRKDAIPESALVVAIVDVYDALVHDRVYRPALPEEKAISIITGCTGDYFGPHIFDCFMSLLPSLRRIREETRDCAPQGITGNADMGAADSRLRLAEPARESYEDSPLLLDDRLLQ